VASEIVFMTIRFVLYMISYLQVVRELVSWMRAVCFGARDMDRGGKVISGCKQIHEKNRERTTGKTMTTSKKRPFWERHVTILLLSRYATGNNSCLLRKRLSLFCTRV